MIRVAVAGALGRMGREVQRLVSEAPDLMLVGAFDRASALDSSATTDLASAIESADVVVDFSSPEGCKSVAELAAVRGTAVVSGTTGLDEAARRALAMASERVPVVHSPNMSVGVNVLLELVAEAARSLGPEFDIEIVEMHHRHKVDAPSGTALRIADAVSSVRADAVPVYGRSGTGGARKPQELGILAVRGGDVVGDHTVYFAGPGERIEIVHRASSRETFARGALRAARWVHGRAPGLYGMSDVLTLS